MAFKSPKRPKLPFMLDIETLSLAGQAAIIDIALAPIMDGLQGKRWLVTPSSYNNHAGFHRDPETLAFHANNKTQLVEDAEKLGHSWQKVADEVHNYLQDFTASYEIHIWAQGKDFDIPKMDNLFKQAGLKTPWKYSHTHCLRDLSGVFSDVKRSWYGNHTAMEDVRAQVSHLKNIAARHDLAYQFIFGD